MDNDVILQRLWQFNRTCIHGHVSFVLKIITFHIFSGFYNPEVRVMEQKTALSVAINEFKTPNKKQKRGWFSKQLETTRHKTHQRHVLEWLVFHTRGHRFGRRRSQRSPWSSTSGSPPDQWCSVLSHLKEGCSYLGYSISSQTSDTSLTGKYSLIYHHRNIE